jgi:hypothetical protein
MKRKKEMTLEPNGQRNLKSNASIVQLKFLKTIAEKPQGPAKKVSQFRTMELLERKGFISFDDNKELYFITELGKKEIQ